MPHSLSIKEYFLSAGMQLMEGAKIAVCPMFSDGNLFRSSVTQSGGSDAPLRDSFTWRLTRETIG